MSTLIQLSGPPGSGKTTSVEKLNPNETFFIDADRKGLAWAG
jgi:broad-specificity NMP kinase